MKLIILFIYIILFSIFKFFFKRTIKNNYLIYFLLLLIFIFLFFIPTIVLKVVGNTNILNSPHVSLNIFYSEQIFRIIDLYTLATFFFLIIGYLVTSKLISSKKPYKHKENFVSEVIIFSILNFISLIATLFLMISSLQGIDGILVVTYLSYLIYALPYMKIMLGIKLAKIQFFLFYFNIFFFLYLNIFLQNGVRTAFIALLGSFVIGLLKKNQLNTKKTIRAHSKVILFIFSALTVHFSIILQYVRWNLNKVGNLTDFLNLIFMNNKEAYLVSIFQGDLIYFYRAAVRTFHVIPSYHDFIYGDTYIRLALFFIPHSLFPNIKPEETQLLLSSILNPGMYLRGQSLPPSLVGDLYINFGYFGPFFAIFIGAAIYYIQNTLNKDHLGLKTFTIAIGSTIFAVILLYFRGTFNAFYYLVFIYFSISILRIILTKLSSRGVYN